MASDESATVSLTLAPTSAVKHRWHKAELGKLLPDAITEAADALAKFNNTAADVLNTIKKGLEIAKALAALASINPLEEALRQALKQIEDFIDGLLGNTSVHGIMIPIQKQYFGYGDPIPPDSLNSMEVTPNYNTLVSTGAFSSAVVRTNTPDTISFINTAPTALGGNAGFYKELVLSTYDSADLARPDFPATYAVTGVALIFGSSSLTDIYRIIALLNRILLLGLQTNLASRTIPNATGLKAQICPIPTKNRIGVIVSWDPVPPVVLKPLFSGEAMIITELILVRSTNPNFRQQWSWTQNFIDEPSDDLNDLPSNKTGTTKVIARIQNGSSKWYTKTANTLVTKNSYIDDDPDLEIGVSYYYGLFLRTTINGETQPVGPCSNVVWVYYRNQVQGSRLSQPPDWFASPSLIQLFPILQDLFSKMKLFVHKYLTRTTSNSGIVNMIEQTIAMIERLVQEAEKYAALLEELEELMRALALADAGGMYVTTFDVGTGGTQAWTSELSRRLSNRSDSSRPPFDNGELTAGFVLVAGAPNLPQLTEIRALFNLFFGKSDTNVFKEVTTAFNKAVYASAVQFNEDMTPAPQTPKKVAAGSRATPTTSPTTEAHKKRVVFNAKMQPSEQLDDC